MTSKQTRNVPTYYLSEQGYRNLKNAIASEFPDGYGLEDLAVTVSKNNDSLHIDTISKIINRTEKVRKSSIKTLFEAFYILLIDNDLTRDLPIINNFEDDPNFVGRNDDIVHLNNLINKGAKIIQIIAPGGTGKTILASKYLESKFKTVLEFPIGKEIKDIASIENLLEFNLRKLGEEPGKELMESLQRLKQKLQNQEIGILIDNLEPALDTSGKFIEQHRSYVELLRILTNSSIKSITLITSRERLCECLDIILYKLPSLNIEAWYEYWHHQEINPNTPILTEIHKVYGGNALAMKVLCNPIINDFNGNIIAYWQENKTEENLEVETVVANLIKE
ncbi:hypothetical protein [Dolichospermum sp. LEGE 00246]|uniref:hypothetical protein n=1 Tax=Dolichospermum sp. LEGE 00246 TaxID=1828605 RepID=UPI0018823EC0|nr:hypothetical protein [Dolichospermum sp. LEGE 00246]MBE9258591.1 hypothetical protein [Dolichospermum sp. LEGE 00246]